MTKHVVRFKERNNRNVLVDKEKVFPDFGQACTHARFIYGKTGQKATVEEKKK